MAKLTKEQKEQKRLMKVEKAVEKAGGIYSYWLDQHRNKELGSFENTTASFLTAMAGSAISKCAIVKADGTRSPLKIAGNVIAGIGLAGEIATIIEKAISLKQAENVRFFLRHHPEVKEEFYSKVSEYLTKCEADIL